MARATIGVERPAAASRPSRKQAVVAGLTGTATVAVIAAVVHTFASAVPFPPVAISQVLVRTTPGGFDSFFIDSLGHWAQRLAVIGTAIGFLASGLLLGLLIPALILRLKGEVRVAGIFSLIPLWLASIVLYPNPPGSLGRPAYALAILPLFVAGGLVAAWSYRRLAAATGAPAGRATDLSRRLLLRSAWAGGVGLLVGAGNVGRLFFRGTDPGQDVLRLRTVTAARRPTLTSGDAAFSQVAGLSPEVTSISQHYVVDEEIIDPDIDPSTWRLAVGGLVRTPVALTYDQLKAFAAVERFQTLECISNRIGGTLISTARWTGVPLPSILERAGLAPGAVEVVFRAAGGYSDSLSIDQAMDGSTLIAIGMNGHVLPRAHGFPARLLSVGTYGMKNPKWLQSIEVVDRPYRGFWEQRGWTKSAIVKTGSRIDTPPSGSAVAATATIAGVAFAGDRGISKVEVSTDGGHTWTRAQLKTALSPYTWRSWLFRWTPTRGRGQADVLVRAFDGRGIQQTPRLAAPYPSGATGYDGIVLER